MRYSFLAPPTPRGTQQTYIHLGVKVGHSLVVCGELVDLHSVGRKFLYDLHKEKEDLYCYARVYSMQSANPTLVTDKKFTYD